MLDTTKKYVPLFIILYKNHKSDDLTQVAHANSSEEFEALKQHIIEHDNLIQLEADTNNPRSIMKLGMYAGANEDSALYITVSSLLSENDKATMEANKDV